MGAALPRLREQGDYGGYLANMLAAGAMAGSELLPGIMGSTARKGVKGALGGAKIPTKMQRATREELEMMPVDDLDRAAFGVAGGDVINVSPNKLSVKYLDDMENPKHRFQQGGMDWVESVDLSQPIKVSVDDTGKLKIEDGHHRYFAAKALGRDISAEIEIKANPINAILRRTR